MTDNRPLALVTGASSGVGLGGSFVDTALDDELDIMAEPGSAGESS
ncbi:MAG: hypothetical protein ACT4O0_14065 [Pseudonocardia sp.]|jgi:short-subunit dehydrogenase